MTSTGRSMRKAFGHLFAAGAGDVGDVQAAQDFADQAAAEIVGVGDQDLKGPWLQRPRFPRIVHFTVPPVLEFPDKAKPSKVIFRLRSGRLAVKAPTR